ncbi:hypothetical protein H70357_10635 [Paenibacillus sp. FSL H7-0357]|uniref:hypothetical protein n=1 Tax=Paenibacillus sp. FSL H7-0357 TaxID=1536774 RepID=UPI0004F6354B|nr:hypothetical protein [Paenibacillus sp. FSL H7-0357]AIQ17065.1 hypothetical protein H70357_10635 [Paenibacillus sp. FSL H7-0357]
MAKKSQATKIEGVDLSNQASETVLLWKATRELSAEEHEQLASKLRLEQEHAGIKIVLVPLSVDVELSTIPTSDPADEPITEPAAEPAADSTDAPEQGGDN